MSGLNEVMDYGSGGSAPSLRTTQTSSDIQIGAVEIKDATSDTRARVTVNGLEVVPVGDSSHDQPDAGNPVKIGYKAYDPTSLPTAVASGDRVNAIASLQGEVLMYPSRLFAGEDQTNGGIAVFSKLPTDATYLATGYQNNSFATINVKGSAGVFLGATIINTTASVRYFQIYNTATTPAGGATAKNKWLVPANSMIVITQEDVVGGIECLNGIAIANSTAASTYTAGSAGDLLVDVFYK